MRWNQFPGLTATITQLDNLATYTETNPFITDVEMIHHQKPFIGLRRAFLYAAVY